MSKQMLKIIGHTSDPTKSGGGSGQTFEARINPTTIRHTKSLHFNTDNSANASNDVKQWQGYGPEFLSFKLVINGKKTSGDTVVKQLDELNKVVYDYNGSIHKSCWNTVQWGTVPPFKCHLKSMSVEYLNFSGKGDPSSAEVDLIFVVHEDREAAEKANNNNSPDMSHIKVLRDGDKLPNLCHEIYSDISYYMQIAELNGLTNFRDIPAGKKLLFPPLI